ncbi:MAG: SMP-30/gluconolactonase/LRE family protein [Planctomycetota bacterium]
MLRIRIQSTFLAFVAPAAFVLPGCTTAHAEPVYPKIGRVERLEPALDELVAPDAQFDVLATGFNFCEGPVWVEQGESGYLLLSDIPRNHVCKWQAGVGKSIYLEQSGYLGATPRPNHIVPDEPGSNGLLLDAQRNLVLCQHGERQVARMLAPLDEPTASYESLALTFDGSRFNSPNDAAFHRNGDLYFTDPPYGLTRKESDPSKQIAFQGVYRASPDGHVTLLTKEMTRPNGIAFSPDFRTLYVANSDPANAIWMAFPVRDDGMLDDGRVLFDATSRVASEKGLPDGIKVDRNGILFATGPGGVFVFTPEGRHLGTLRTGQITSNCAFGEDGSTLFVTAHTQLLRMRLATVGAGF